MSDHIKYLDISALSEAGILDGKIPAALRSIRNAAFWDDWGLKALLTLGVGHVLAGVIFFFAYNWNDLTPFVKFAIVQGGLVLSVIAWIFTRLDKASAAFGISATVLIGVLLAVFGQLYQTPAKLYTMFFYWAGLSLPFALASRSHAHWTVWIAIALFGFIQYTGTGISEIHGDRVATFVVLATGIFFLGVLALYNRLMTDQGRGNFWFRMVLLIISLGLLVAAFSYGFWDVPKMHLVYLAALLLLAGVIFYLYQFRPSIPALSLASFALVACLAQFAFEVLNVIGFDELVLSLFVVGFWFILMTLLLAFLFRHFLKTFGQPRDEKDDGISLRSNKTVTEFSGSSDLSAELVETSLKEYENSTPWYMELFLGICGVLTAIIVGLFFGLLFTLTFNIENTAVFIPVGAAILAISMFLRLKSSSIYTIHLLNTFILAGGALFLAGFGEIIDEYLLGLLILVSALGVAFIIKDRILEFILGGTAFTGFALFISEFFSDHAKWISAGIAILVATFFFLYPIRRRFYIAGGLGLLVAATLLFVIDGQSYFYATYSDYTQLLSKLVLTAGFAGSVYWINHRMGLKGQDMRPHLWVLVPLVIAVAILPIGAALPLLLMVFGYIIGSWPLALLGIVFQIYFLWMFYYDLSITLLHKSILLVVTGLIFVVLWAWLTHRGQKAVST